MIRQYIDNFIEYTLAILKKWILWIFIALDFIGFLVVYTQESIEVPNIIYPGIAIFGIYIAGYMVFLDNKVSAHVVARAVELDREFLDTLMDVLPSSGTMTWMRDYDFGGTFDVDWLEDLHKFVQECRKPEFEFINPELEELKGKLQVQSETFLNLIGLETYPINMPNRLLNQLPPESPKYEEIRKKLNSHAQAISDVYNELIKKARRL